AGAPLFTSNHGPIKITSETMSLDYKNKLVLFIGHVHATQAGSQLTSDSLVVQYGENFKDVKDMTANGNVRMSQGTRYATSDHAIMNQQEQTVVLTGHPVVHDGPDQITGTRITVYIKTGKSVVEEAQAVLFPRQSQTPDNGITDGKTPPAGSPARLAPAASLP
ncbi:MAG: LptA/OstA family protein, partial [Candidatus Binataceae bacterium]